jgi:dephospho-CoA kinase
MAILNVSLARPHIGLVGGIASGKSTICDILAGIGYTSITLSTFVAEEIRANHVTTIDRRTYFQTANELRREKGNDVLCRLAISYITRNNINHFVVDGLRTLDEVRLMRLTFDDFFLIGVRIPLDKRVERVLARRRAIDPDSISDILLDMEREAKDVTEGCQLADVLDICDVSVDGQLPISATKDLLVRLVQP